jgi:hypothetical protein
MNTQVQLRSSGSPTAQLLHGDPREVRAGLLGPIALFGAGALVAYQVRSRRRCALFIFRTLNVDDRLAASIPGVHPRVQLLLDLHASKPIRRVRGLFAYLRRNGRNPSQLPDDFFLRAGVALSGPLPAQRILYALLPPTVSR